MRPSTRRSYSSARVNCSNGSDPGCAAASVTRSATTASSIVTPARAAGRRRWRHRAAPGSSGASTNAPALMGGPMRGSCERPIEHVGAGSWPRTGRERSPSTNPGDDVDELRSAGPGHCRSGAPRADRSRRSERDRTRRPHGGPGPSVLAVLRRRTRHLGATLRGAGDRVVTRKHRDHGVPAARRRGTRPARTSELLPDPGCADDGDQTTTIRRACSNASRRRRARRTRRRRPRRTGAVPCTGSPPAAVGRGEAEGRAARRAESTARRSSEADR